MTLHTGMLRPLTVAQATSSMVRPAEFAGRLVRGLVPRLVASVSLFDSYFVVANFVTVQVTSWFDFLCKINHLFGADLLPPEIPNYFRRKYLNLFHIRYVTPDMIFFVSIHWYLHLNTSI